MKILLMGFAKMKYMPYMEFYRNGLRDHEVHVLYWNRDGQPESCPGGVTGHEYFYHMEDDIPKLHKLRGFFGYRQFALRLLKQGGFDFLVVLHSLPGVLLADRLPREYRGRFIFDFRDLTYEHFPPYRRVIHSLTDAARAVFISSDGFRPFLPDNGRIHTSHNLRPEAVRRQRHTRREGPVRIAFWGLIRHEAVNRKLMERLDGDGRFELHFYGREQETARKLKAYAAKLQADNIFFHGGYEPGEQERFAREADLLHNLYSNTESPSQRYAVTNKYYDGLSFRLPQLCMHGSFMGALAQEQGVGLACDPEDADFADRVWEFYRGLDRDTFDRRCDAALEQALREYEEGSRVMKDAVGSA